MAKPQIQSLQVFRGRAALAVVAHRAVPGSEAFYEFDPDSEPGQSMHANQAAARQRLEFSAWLTARAWIAGQARNDKGRGKPVIPGLTRDLPWRGQPGHETASACLKPLPCGHGLRVPGSSPGQAQPAMTDAERAHGAMTKKPCHPGLDPGSTVAG